MKIKRFLKNNGLSLVFISLFFLSLIGQWLTGCDTYNKNREEDGLPAIPLTRYTFSGHFIQATFENWESEFLQMALFVWLTIFLTQKGSSESKKPEGGEEVDREPDPEREGAPAPVKKGGWRLWLYERSLTIVLLIMFLLSFVLHLYGSLKDENEEMLRKGGQAESLRDYLADTRFWFESFQNWQSEFLSVFAIIILSVFLRQKGSPQSKPVDASHNETGA
jgi:hypothetical protein